MTTLFAGALMPAFIPRKSSGRSIALLSAYGFAFHLWLCFPMVNGLARPRGVSCSLLRRPDSTQFLQRIQFLVIHEQFDPLAELGRQPVFILVFLLVFDTQ